MRPSYRRNLRTKTGAWVAICRFGTVNIAHYLEQSPQILKFARALAMQLAISAVSERQTWNLGLDFKNFRAGAEQGNSRSLVSSSWTPVGGSRHAASHEF